MFLTDLEAEYEVPDSDEDVLDIAAGARQVERQQVADTQEGAHADQSLEQNVSFIQTFTIGHVKGESKVEILI